MDGMETGTQENVGGMPAGPEPYNPTGETMPTDGGPGSSATPAPGPVASPGPDEYNMTPNVSASSDEQIGQIGKFLGGTGPSAGPRLDSFANMPTPDN